MPLCIKMYIYEFTWMNESRNIQNYTLEFIYTYRVQIYTAKWKMNIIPITGIWIGSALCCVLFCLGIYIYIVSLLFVREAAILYAHVTIIINDNRMAYTTGMQKTSVDHIGDKQTSESDFMMITRSIQCKNDNWLQIRFTCGVHTSHVPFDSDSVC